MTNYFISLQVSFTCIIFIPSIPSVLLIHSIYHFSPIVQKSDKSLFIFLFYASFYTKPKYFHHCSLFTNTMNVQMNVHMFTNIPTFDSECSALCERSVFLFFALEKMCISPVSRSVGSVIYPGFDGWTWGRRALGRSISCTINKKIH